MNNSGSSLDGVDDVEIGCLDVELYNKLKLRRAVVE
jgi:hypothetical protein